jgi:hypothetical protein
VVSLAGSETNRSLPATDLLVTKDADLLDPTSPPENKYYARGIGPHPDHRTRRAYEAVKIEKF